MNAIFTTIIILSSLVISFKNPDLLLKTLTDGASKSLTLCFDLLIIYTVWSGILQVAENSGLVLKLSKLLKPLIDRLFKSKNPKTTQKITVNISANLLGMGGIATPLGIEATTMLTGENNHDGACLLFILASTSIQIIPTTVISLRQTYKSVSPFDIFLPSLICTIISTLIGITLFFLTKKGER